VLDAVTIAEINAIDVAVSVQSSDRKFTLNVLGRDLEYVKNGLKSWENFKDKDEKEVVIKTTSARRGGRQQLILQDESLSRLSGRVIRELAAAIREICEISEDEEKN
jgi:hypothetical protein